MIYYQSESASLLCGDCLTMLKLLPDKSVHCCVTSPPYYGLRDYGVDGQIGLESTPDAYVAELVAVFREVRRVLRDDGVVWLNLGDSYSSYKDCKSVPDSLRVGGRSESANKIEKGKSVTRNTRVMRSVGLKDKDLIGIPWRVAFALQADGWYLRQDIIWHKPNPMPESVKDRCTKAHEYIFLLSKSPKYYFDAKGIGEPLATAPHKPGNNNATLRTAGPNDRGGKSQWDDTKERVWCKSGYRNKRSVWTVTTKPFKGAHFATFPPDLIEPCILAGCPKDGVVLDPFNGAGTVGVVALKHSRKYLGIELNPEYCKITLDRWGVKDA